MGCVYCAKNKINGKLYIGKTTKDLSISNIGKHSKKRNCIKEK